jgi:hypothetical protein
MLGRGEGRGRRRRDSIGGRRGAGGALYMALLDHEIPNSLPWTNV